MPLTANDLASWSVETAGDSPVLAHARDEWRLALASRTAGGGAGTLRLEIDATNPGAVIDVDEDRVTIRARTPRLVLDGVYTLLERLGCVFPGPGTPPAWRNTLPLQPGTTSHIPSFSRRTIILGQDAFHDDWPGWIEWASRNRCNDIFFHDTPPSRLNREAPRPATAAELAADGGSWLFERWESDGAHIAAEAHKRGMTIQFAGHHLAALLPRDIFDLHPGWFPLRNGVRDPRYNLCLATTDAQSALGESAKAFVRRFPGADTYHLWADDIRGGGWCECEGCRHLTPTDQALRATNIVARAISDDCGARVPFLAYRDTLAPPSTIQPEPNVSLLWAPRERCYAHSIADPACDRNARLYWPQFQALAAAFGSDPSRIDIFEYYSDGILFQGLAPHLPTVLAADARAYAGLGAGSFQDLVVGPRPWFGLPMHAFLFAQAAWDADAGLAPATRQCVEAAFPTAHAVMGNYFEALEHAYTAFLDLGGLEWERAPRHDVLDFAPFPEAAFHAKAETALEAFRGLDEGGSALASATAVDIAESALLAAEKLQAEFVKAWAGNIACRTAAWSRARLGTEGASDLLQEAQYHLECMEALSYQHVPPAFAVIAIPMLRRARRHTGEVASVVKGGG